MQRELSQWKKRVKELEAELRRTSQALAKHRQMHQINHAYGKEAFGPEGERRDGRPAQPSEPMITRREHDEEIQRLTRSYESKLRSAANQHAQELAELKKDGLSRDEQEKARAKREKEERVELLKRQIGRRIMNAGLSRGWTAWTECWRAKVYALQRLKECIGKEVAVHLS